MHVLLIDDSFFLQPYHGCIFTTLLTINLLLIGLYFSCANTTATPVRKRRAAGHTQYFANLLTINFCYLCLALLLWLMCLFWDANNMPFKQRTTCKMLRSEVFYLNKLRSIQCMRCAFCHRSFEVGLIAFTFCTSSYILDVVPVHPTPPRPRLPSVHQQIKVYTMKLPKLSPYY